MKALSRILTGVGIVIVLFLVIAALIPVLFRDEIEEVVKREAGKRTDATIEWSSVSLSLLGSFPHLTVSVKDFSFTPLDLSRSNAVIAVDDIAVGFDLLNAIRAFRGSGELTVRRINLERPRIFALVIDEKQEAQTKPTAEKPGAAPEEAIGDLVIELEDYRINDAQITYKNNVSDLAIRLEGFTHSGSGDFSKEVFDLSTETHIDGLTLIYKGIPYLNHVETNILLDTRVENFETFTIRENTVRLNALTLSLNGTARKRGEEIDLDVNFSSPDTEFRDIISLIPALYGEDFESIQSSGTLAVSGKVKGTYAKKALPAFRLDLRVENGMFRYPDQPVSVEKVKLGVQVANVGGDLDNTLITVRDFHADIGGQPLDVSLTIKNPVSDPFIDAAIRGKLDLAHIRNLLPGEEETEVSGTVDADVRLKGLVSTLEQGAYDRFTAAGTLVLKNIRYREASRPQELVISSLVARFNPGSVNIEGFTGRYGESDFRIEGRLVNLLPYLLRGKTLKGALSLESKNLVVDELTGPGEEDADRQEKAEKPAGDEKGPIVIPERLDITLTAKADRIGYDKLSLRSVSGTTRIREQALDVENMRMNALGGTISMNGRYDSTDAVGPRVDFSISMEKLDVRNAFESLMSVRKFAPVAGYTEGTFSTGLNFRGSLTENFVPVYESINADGALTIISATVKNFEPLSGIANRLNLEKLAAFSMENVKQHFTIREGRFFVEEFGLSVDRTNMRISGSHGLDRSLDYLIKMAVPRSVLGSSANSLIEGLLEKARAQGIDYNPGETIKFTVLVKGTVDNPRISTDLSDQVKSSARDIAGAAGDMLEERKEQALDTAKEELEKRKKQAEKILQDAEKKAALIREEALKAADRVRAEGYARAAQLENEATDPVSRRLAGLAADNIRKKTDSEAGRLIDEADGKAKKVMEEARERAAKIMNG